MDIRQVKKKGYIVHCKTEKEAERIIKLANIHYYTFKYSIYGTDTCLNVAETKFAGISLYQGRKKIICSTTIGLDTEFTIKLNLI